MVKYAISTFKADPDRVYATGVSSGAMMTNVLLGSYPTCSGRGRRLPAYPSPVRRQSRPASLERRLRQGTSHPHPREWGDAVRAAYPGYTGPRPGCSCGTAPATRLSAYVNFGEEIKQWTDVHGVSQNPVSTERNTPQTGWTRTRYGRPPTRRWWRREPAGTSHNLPYRPQRRSTSSGWTLPIVKPTTTGPVPPCAASASTSAGGQRASWCR